MSGFDPLFTSDAGIEWSLGQADDGRFLIHSEADVTAVLEQNRAMESHNNGYTPSKDMRRVASIPLIVLQKWKDEEGWDPFSPDPDCQRKLAQKLDDPEWRYLRTAPGTVGDHYKHHK